MTGVEETPVKTTHETLRPRMVEWGKKRWIVKSGKTHQLSVLDLVQNGSFYSRRNIPG